MPTAVEPAWPVLDVTPELTICITSEMPALDPAVDEAVERLWRAARRERPLFNGTVFCADRVGPARIEGHWTEYRRALAQMQDPALRPALRIRSLAVCGALRCADGVALARREAGSVYQAGEWQLPPAGSVDAGAAEPGGASWQRALLAELREELGIGAEQVRGLRPLCLVQHPTGVLDLGIEIATDLSSDALIAAHARGGNREYDELVVLPPAAVADWVTQRGGRMVPSVAAFLARLNSAEGVASYTAGDNG